MGRIIQLIKNKIGKEEQISPIIEADLYIDLLSSSCGGTLKGKKVIFITDSNILSEAINKKCTIEKIDCFVIELSKEDNNIELYKKHFEIADIVVNMLSNYGQMFNDDNSYKRDDINQRLYRIMQKETEYFIKNLMTPIICSVVFLAGNTIETSVLKSGVKSLLHGLGYILPNHGIVSNAVIVDNNVNIEEVMNMTIFLVSKYGYALTGEVIEMS